MDWLGAAAETHPDRAAVVTVSRTVSYAELDRLATVVAGIVLDSGLGAGESVAFWGSRDLATVAALWGIPRAGATAMPIDPSLPPVQLMERTRNLGVRGLWAIPDFDVDRALRRPLPDTRRHRVGVPDAEACFVIHTSGSTGEAKGVVLTGSNIEAAAKASQARVGNTADDRWLCALPLFHVGGLSVLWRSAREAATVVLEDVFDVTRVAHLVGTGEVTIASLVPTMLRRLIPALRGVGPMRAVLVGGGPVDEGLLASALDAGLPVLATYGMTEASSQVATMVLGDQRESLGTAGPPLDGMEVRIGDEGRIEIRGAAVSTRYLNEVSRDANDWFVTSDEGRIDEEGRLVVLGRADRVAVTGGELVRLDDVERVVASHDGVVEVRVRAEPDAEWGMALVAEVVLRETAVDDVAAWTRDRLPAFGVPKRWEAVDALADKLER